MRCNSRQRWHVPADCSGSASRRAVARRWRPRQRRMRQRLWWRRVGGWRRDWRHNINILFRAPLRTVVHARHGSTRRRRYVNDTVNMFFTLDGIKLPLLFLLTPLNLLRLALPAIAVLLFCLLFPLFCLPLSQLPLPLTFCATFLRQREFCVALLLLICQSRDL